jgi:hypothetical protein
MKLFKNNLAYSDIVMGPSDVLRFSPVKEKQKILNLVFKKLLGEGGK